MPAKATATAEATKAAATAATAEEVRVYSSSICGIEVLSVDPAVFTHCCCCYCCCYCCCFCCCAVVVIAVVVGGCCWLILVILAVAVVVGCCDRKLFNQQLEITVNVGPTSLLKSESS